MATHPQHLIDPSPMSGFQVRAVATTIGLNALDGFDVLSISFAAPGIAREWGVLPAALGIVLSMELLGMVAGSLLLGRLADRWGRRPLILCCLVLMALGMAAAVLANSIVVLAACRILTGVGIGGMVATINAVTAEFSNARRRSLCVSLMVSGYPVGAVIGGAIAAWLLQTTGDWRTIFLFGALVTLLFIPLVWLAVPESVGFLTARQPRGALPRINHTLRRMGLGELDSLPPRVEQQAGRSGPSGLFGPDRIATTLLVTAAFFAHMFTFYFVLKWTPKLVVDMGFPPASAAMVLVWVNAGGILAGTIFGVLTQWISLKKLTVGVLLGAFASVAFFGLGKTDLGSLTIAAAIAGMFINAGVVGLYAIFAEVFPTRLRASGTGFAVGLGRGGAILAPILAGVLLEWGSQVTTVVCLMALGSLIAILPLARLPVGLNSAAA